MVKLQLCNVMYQFGYIPIQDATILTADEFHSLVKSLIYIVLLIFPCNR